MLVDSAAPRGSWSHADQLEGSLVDLWREACLDRAVERSEGAAGDLGRMGQVPIVDTDVEQRGLARSFGRGAIVAREPPWCWSGHGHMLDPFQPDRVGRSVRAPLRLQIPVRVGRRRDRLDIAHVARLQLETELSRSAQDSSATGPGALAALARVDALEAPFDPDAVHGLLPTLPL